MYPTSVLLILRAISPNKVLTTWYKRLCADRLKNRRVSSETTFGPVSRRSFWRNSSFDSHLHHGRFPRCFFWAARNRPRASALEADALLMEPKYRQALALRPFSAVYFLRPKKTDGERRPPEADAVNSKHKSRHCPRKKDLLRSLVLFRALQMLVHKRKESGAVDLVRAIVDVKARLFLSSERGIDREYLRQDRTRYYRGEPS
jgi:hypothetical protein